ncbi:MAG: LacI family DNA-binding transcriptional regulator [Luteolibacter sp.]|uniref:LacI family DNA-binding transcriptional regulator n=1 Tax=Luteolibacter sp. TaxID=1962973 RepID=UPI0032661F95
MKNEPHSHRISLRDLAKLVGVSHVTVSLALRDSPQISVATREKIKAVAEEHGYRPDPMLTALSNYSRSKSEVKFHAAVGWINAWKEPDKLRGYEEFDAYWTGANRAAQKLGYRLEEFRIGADFPIHRLHRVLSSRGIRGLLLPPHSEQPDWGDFPWENYFVVKFGRSLYQPQTHLVTADQVLNTVGAFEKMLELGYKRIGFVSNEPYLRVHGHLFEAGFVIAQHSVDAKQRLPVLSLAGLKPTEHASQLEAWIRKYRPDAIFSDIRGILASLKKAKLRVPADVAVAATTLIDTGVDSGIDQHPEEIGRVGMLLLNSIINDRAIGTPSIFRQVLVEGSWVQGGSMPPKVGPGVPGSVVSR